MSEHNPGGPESGPDEDAQQSPGDPSFEEAQAADDGSPEAIEKDPSSNPSEGGLKDRKGG
jgi:hypothetical protein